MQDRLGIFDTPPDRQQIRLSLGIVGLFFAAFLLILPVRNVRLSEIDAFIPMIDTFMFLGELITATLLYAQAAVFRSRALNALATGYVFAALLDVAHALTFPGAFAPNGLLGAGLNSTGWIAAFRRAGLAIAVILYVQLKRVGSVAQPGKEKPAARIGMGVFAAFALAALATVMAIGGQDLLPPQFLNRVDVVYSNSIRREAVLIALFTVAAITLFRARSSVLDTWLLVALSGWQIQSFLITALHGRFTAGWYWLFAMTLFSHLVVMLALIVESNRLFARLALTTAATKREREARLMSIYAITAAISHEVGQPLTAVTLNASAGLDALTRPRPDVDRAIKSLRAIRDAGDRTFDVIKSIRAMFAKGPGLATEFSLNELVRETAALMDRELAGGKVSVQLALDETLPPVRADRVQMQRVLVNLMTNAIESLGAIRRRGRRIAIRSAALDGAVLLEVSDNGTGITPEEMPHIFDAFFTTKATGTGLGLSLCRTIVEEHGGRLWASQGEPNGATFHLQLPAR